MSTYPQDLKYTKDHEWARLEGKQVTVGITHHAQSALGDVVFLELPEVGKELKKGDTFGVIESVKAVSDLYSPVSGKVIDVHSALLDNPSPINSDPHSEGWLVKIQISDAPSDLLDSASYSEYVQSL